MLWRYLGGEHADCHLTAVKLMYILHQVSPSSWVCEDVIGAQLTSNDEVSGLGDGTINVWTENLK